MIEQLQYLVRLVDVQDERLNLLGRDEVELLLRAMLLARDHLEEEDKPRATYVIGYLEYMLEYPAE